MAWEFGDITNVLCKMPSLQRLALYLYTTDKRLFNKQNLDTILPSSLILIDLFFIYASSESSIEADTLVDTWPPGRISISPLLNELNQCAIIRTVPFNLKSIIIPAVVGKNILPVWKHMQKVENLNMNGDLSSIDLLMILEHLHQLRILKIDLVYSSDVVTQSIPSIVLHLPKLKQLKITGSCELFDLIKAAPNLDDLSIDFYCYKKIINDESICKLLRKQIVRLTLFRLEHVETIKLDFIINQFKNLRYMVLCVKYSSVVIDSLVLQALELWREEELMYLFIKGTLSRNGNQTIRQWFVEHSSLLGKISSDMSQPNEGVHLWI